MRNYLQALEHFGVDKEGLPAGHQRCHRVLPSRLYATLSGITLKLRRAVLAAVARQPGLTNPTNDPTGSLDSHSIHTLHPGRLIRTLSRFAPRVRTAGR